LSRFFGNSFDLSLAPSSITVRRPDDPIGGRDCEAQRCGVEIKEAFNRAWVGDADASAIERNSSPPVLP
jgi:hypothetical protein